MRTWKNVILPLCLSVGLSLAACDGGSGGSGGGESGPGEDTAAATDGISGEDSAAPADTVPGEDTPQAEDTPVQGDAPFGSCDSQGLTHTCTEYYGAEEYKDTIVTNSEGTCAAIQGTWQADTPCTTDGLMATCTQDIGGGAEVVTIGYYYDEAGVTSGQQICDGVGGVWETY